MHLSSQTLCSISSLVLLTARLIHSSHAPIPSFVGEEINLDMIVDDSDPKNPLYINSNGDTFYSTMLAEGCCQQPAISQNEYCEQNSGDAPGHEVYFHDGNARKGEFPMLRFKCCTRVYKKESLSGDCTGHGPWFKRQVFYLANSVTRVVMVPRWKEQAEQDGHEPEPEPEPNVVFGAPPKKSKVKQVKQYVKSKISRQ